MKRVLNFLTAYLAALALLVTPVSGLLIATPAHAQVAVDTAKTGTTRAATLLCASAVAASVTGTTNETTLATCTIPAGAMGLNGGIEIRTAWTVTNSANNKTPRIRFGGAAGTQYLTTAQTTVASLGDVRRIRNRGSASSQVGSFASSSLGVGPAGGALVTSSVDTTSAVDLVLTAQLALAGETITLESYEVWLLPG